MSLFGVLGNGRGHSLLASEAVPRRRLKRLPAERLAVERLAAVLDMLSAASPTAASSQLEGWDPQHTSGARQPRHARARLSAPRVTEPVDSAHLIPAPEVPGVGRHRRMDVPVAAAHPSPAPEVPDAGRHRRMDVPVAVDSAHPSPAPVILAPAAPGAGHHRRRGMPVVVALRGVRVASQHLVLLGVLVLLVAVAVVLGVRGSGALSSAQPRVGAAAYSGLAGR